MIRALFSGVRDGAYNAGRYGVEFAWKTGCVTIGVVIVIRAALTAYKGG